MDYALLQHLLALAGKTGDRLIVVDPSTKQPFVLMGVSQYEALIGDVISAPVRIPAPTGAVTVDVSDAAVQQANADIAAWRAQQPQLATTASQTIAVPDFVPEPLQSATVDDDRFYVEPLE